MLASGRLEPAASLARILANLLVGPKIASSIPRHHRSAGPAYRAQGVPRTDRRRPEERDLVAPVGATETASRRPHAAVLAGDVRALGRATRICGPGVGPRAEERTVLPRHRHYRVRVPGVAPRVGAPLLPVRGRCRVRRSCSNASLRPGPRWRGRARTGMRSAGISTCIARRTTRPRDSSGWPERRRLMRTADASCTRKEISRRWCRQRLRRRPARPAP